MLTLRGPKGPRRGSALEELAIIHDGSLLLRDGVLQEVGPTRRVENLALARDAVEINAGGRVVMPGFVDSHTHLLFPSVGLADSEMAAGARSLRSTTGLRLETKARLHLEAMARHGTTTVEVKTGCGPDPSAELKILRVLASLKQKPLDIVPTFLLRLPHADFWADERWPVLEEWIGTEFLPKIRRRSLARFADLYWQEDAGLGTSGGQYLDLARHIGLGGKVHAEVPSPGAAVALAAEHQAASIDHLENASADDAAVLGRSETLATLLPGASFHRDGRYAPARTLIEAGGAVALATNFNPQHTPTLNMQAVGQLARNCMSSLISVACGRFCTQPKRCVQKTVTIPPCCNPTAAT